MTINVRHLTDPTCPRSWASEPARRRLEWELGGSLEHVEVMGGMGRELGVAWSDTEAGAVAGRDTAAQLVADWIRVAGASGMPIDPRLWLEAPLRTSYPACMAVKAAAEQGDAAASRYLRAAREGVMCRRIRLDHTDALVATAREAGLDAERFRIDLSSHAIVERFGADLEEARSIPEELRATGAVATTEGRERVPFPSTVFVSESGERHAVWGLAPYERLREAAIAAGARPERSEPPGPVAAVEHFGRLATREVEELCDRPGPVVRAELWSAAREWRLQASRAFTDWLWEPAR